MIDALPPSAGEIWHHWTKWEEVTHNMWGSVSYKQTWLEMAISFTGNHELYGEWMHKVIEEWPNSCQHNLTKPGDKRAWLGHAAVALAIGCPEDIVRQAWGYLSEEQQTKANKQAELAIEKWRSQHA